MQLTSLDQIDRNYRHIYLQPHFDDAALSAGGAIALQHETGQRPLIVTVFGGIPPAGAQISAYAQQLHQRMGLGNDIAEAVRKRRAEDAAAADILGADTLWLDYLDAIYRGSPALYTAEEQLFGAVNPGDLQLDEELAGVFGQIVERSPQAAIYAPLGIGGHVDHQLCCSAADRLAQRKVNVKFYEDFPYVTQPGALAARQSQLNIQMEPELVEISGMIPTKLEAATAYTSQIGQLFQSEDRLRTLLNSYATSIRKTYPGIALERYWRW
ncbi:MAG TPA: PIG-L family deacetylase [Ktedonobacterales bacterium]|nr:PIG-L family deacetylase [Ktedonobacterales bacterium]